MVVPKWVKVIGWVVFLTWQGVVTLGVLAGLNKDLPDFLGDWILPFWASLGVAAPYLLTVGGLIGAGIVVLSLADALHSRRDASMEILSSLRDIRADVKSAGEFAAPVDTAHRIESSVNEVERLLKSPAQLTEAVVEQVHELGARIASRFDYVSAQVSALAAQQSEHEEELKAAVAIERIKREAAEARARELQDKAAAGGFDMKVDLQPVAMESEENLDRLRQLRGPCQRALGAAVDVIRNGLQGKIFEADDSRGNIILSLIAHFPMAAAEETRTALNTALDAVSEERAIPVDGFTDLVNLYKRLLGEYSSLCRWYLVSGRVLAGDTETQRVPGYSQLVTMHEQLVAKLDALEGLRGFSQISWFAGELRNELPPYIPKTIADLPPELRPRVPSPDTVRPPDAIEVSIGPKTETNFVGFLPMTEGKSNKPIAVMLLSYFDDLRITNNDPQATTIEDIWVEIDGAKPLETDKCDFKAVGASVETGVIGARRSRSFTLDYNAVFPVIANETHLEGRIALCVKAVGLGIFKREIPDWMFLKERADANPQS